MKIGLVARADRTGLATLTWEFSRNMRPERVLVIDPRWGGSGQRIDATMYDDYLVMSSDPYPTVGIVEDPVVDEFLDDLDVVFTAETPYNYWVFERARQRGVKTVLQCMFEFLDWPLPGRVPGPDLYAAPSRWRWNDLPFENKVFLPVPVNRAALPYARRESLHTLLHTAGTGAGHDRNGTQLVVEAMRLLPKDVDVELTLRSHRPIPKARGRRVRTVARVADRYTEMYDDEDVYLMPRKYGGLCLPLNEASACGMPVVMTDIPPQNELLPPEALLPAQQVDVYTAHAAIEVFETTPQFIADRITELYRNPALVAALSDAADAYADSISWERLAPVYSAVFEDLVCG
jgi:glycosyltransferase involved in cell wall biosynthesis